MNIRKNNLNVQGPSFSGHRRTLDKTGCEQHNFYFLYDSAKYNCSVELFNIQKDNKGNFSIENKVDELEMKDGGITTNLSFDTSEGFAYRFKLTDKTNNKVAYGFDNGTVIGIFDKDPANKFNVVLPNRAIINKNGPMQLIMPDAYYPGVVAADSQGKYQVDKAKREAALKAVRTHANKLGGKFSGIIARLPEISKEGIKRIVGTPFTKDTISSHLYWTENAYQVAPDLGTEEDFKKLQVELFKNDINWIADAALVNEGFGGIHLSEVLRKGAEGTSKGMFRTSEKLSLGILPDDADEKGFTRMKMINAPFILEADGKTMSKNPKYDAKKPTFIQFYDERLASEEQKDSQSPSRLTTYDKRNTDNVYDITKHDDAVYPFPIEVSPMELERNIKEELKKNKSGISVSRANTLSTISSIKNVARFSHFDVTEKTKAGGLEVWDGNVDIAKLNFYQSSSYDETRFRNLSSVERADLEESFKKGSLAVRDYALNSGKYWTQLTADTQLQYVSQLLSSSSSEDYMQKIKAGVAEGKLPKSTLDVVDKEVIHNVLIGKYNLKRLSDADKRNGKINPDGDGNDYSAQDYILRKSMDVPLETLPVATNLLGILTSPYLAKKANTEEELGVSRFDLQKAGNPNLPKEYKKTYAQMDEIYSDIAKKTEEILSDIDGVKDKYGKITNYGRYVVSEMTPDLTRYLLLKALAPNAEIPVSEDGNFDFTKVNPEDITMQSLGISYNGLFAKDEAQVVLNRLSAGLGKIEGFDLSKIKTAVTKRFEGRTLEDFKFAEMIIDRTESGLGWRIDAAKDIASIDAVRTGYASVDSTWDKVIDFWKLYNDSVTQINPHAYTTAEITDLPDLFEIEEKDLSDAEKAELKEKRKYKSAGDAERKFLKKTGITSVANYNYFFSLLPELFALNSFETGDVSWMSFQQLNHVLREKLTKGWCDNPGFLFNSPADGVENSYTFFGNHDKPRPLHCLALDMGLFTSDFAKDKKSSYKDKTHREVAADVLQKDIKNINFDSINPMAIAMGQRLKDVLGNDEEIAKSIATLASGSHKGSKFDPTAFGTRPFDIAIDTIFKETEYRTGKKIENKEVKKAAALKEILVPAYDRYKSMYKLLIALPGSPTDFAGDRVGASGYETKAKNYHQQNRNTIHWEWLEDSKYSFMKTIYDDINTIANLRNRTELSALNDGSTIAVPLFIQEKDDEGNTKVDKENKVVRTHTKAQAMIRYNNKDSVIISLHDLTGASTPLDKKMDRRNGLEISDDDKRLYLNLNDTIGEEDGNLEVRRGLKFGLEKNTKFKNALDLDNPDAPYYQVGIDDNGYYYLEKLTKDGAQPIVIEPRDLNTLLLCKVK